MKELRARLVGASSRVGLPGWRIEARWTAEEIPVRRSAVTGIDGSFVLEYPETNDAPQGLVFSLSTPEGTRAVERNEPPPETWEVAEPQGGVVDPVPPNVAVRERISGRVIDTAGRPLPSGTPVAIVGTAPEATTAQVLLQVLTGTGGYFQAPRPAAALTSASARVAGTDAGAVPLDEDGRVARRVIIVAARPAAPTEPCACGDTPPRNPELEDLTRFSEGFSGDAGGRCVDLTVPSRVVEEIVYHKVVRITQPEIAGTTTKPPRLHPAVYAAVSELVGAEMSTDPNRPPPPPVRADIAARLFSRPDRLDPAVLEKAQYDSQHADLHDEVRAFANGSAGRVPENAAKAVNWDGSPHLYQAVTIAHGHLLQYRQVWRADGYSLGDLLYSLPLAPGQKKLVSLLDWSRLDEAVREEWTTEEEELSAFLERDRDVLEVVDSHLLETSRGGSSANTWGGGGGIGVGAIGTGWGVFAGVAGGAGGSASQSWQNSGRDVAMDGMQSIRDKTVQGASVVRSTRSTVIQTDHQAERAQATTEVVVNYNHCHALTIEYFEVLRHFTVTHELAGVSECLFVPMPMGTFDLAKALRWRETLLQFLRDPALRAAFAAAQRVQAGWVGYDVPLRSFAEEAPESLEGELWVSFIIPRPRDDQDGKYQVAEWRWLQKMLPQAPLELWTSRMNQRAAAERDLVFKKEVAPGVAANLVRRLRFSYILTDGSVVAVPLDATLVGQFTEGTPLYVSLRPAGGLPGIPREQIQMFRVSLDGIEFPEDARVLVHRGKARYDTPHLRHLLFDEPRDMGDLAAGDDVIVSTPLDPEELRDPRQDDRDMAARLLTHLDDHLDYYHQILWMTMDPGRRYLLLDGFQAPNANGRSVASVVENRLLGIVGNCLVMPVSPGNVLAKPLEDDRGNVVPLMEHYAVPPERPIRITVPTRGVFAEAVQGSCNSCERIDDTRLWRFDESPLPDTPVAPEAPTTESRVQAPVDATPTAGPQSIVNIQAAPALPDPMGLSSVFSLMAKSDLFKDVTGLQANQNAALGAYQAALDTAKTFAGYASAAVLQQDLSKNIGRTLERAEAAKASGLLTEEQANSVAYGALRGLIGDTVEGDAHPLANPGVNEAVNKAAEAESGTVNVTSGTHEVSAAFEGDGEVVLGKSPLAASTTMHGEWPTMSVYLDATKAQATSPRKIDTVADLEAALMQQATTQQDKDAIWSELEAAGWMRRSGTKIAVHIRYQMTIPSGTTTFGKPAGSGKLPLVVILHGNPGPPLSSTNPMPSHLGFQDLQDHLATLGFASISVDDNVSVYLQSRIEMRARHTVAAIDDVRKRASKGDLKNRIDFEKVILVGHSRGGDAVVRAAELLRGSATKVLGVALIAATDRKGPANGVPLTPSDTSFLLAMYGTHDGDVSGQKGVAPDSGGTTFRHYQRATCAKAHLHVDFASHNRFNAIWGDPATKWGTPPSSSGVDEPRIRSLSASLLSPADHRALLRDYIGALAKFLFKGDASAAKLLDGRTANSIGKRVSHLHQFGGPKTTQDPRGLLPLVVDLVEKAGIDAGGIRTLATSEGVEVVDTSAKSIAKVMAPSEMSATTSAVFIPLDARVTNPSTPRSTVVMNTPRDVKGFQFLELDLMVLGDVSTSATTAAIRVPTKLTALLLDGSSNASNLVDVLATRTPRVPVWKELMTGSAPAPAVLYRFETMRVPLAQFTGVDKKRIMSVHLRGDSSNLATVLIDNIRFVREV